MREMTERDKKLRLLYGAAFLVLMAVETLIALYVHDKVIRPYVGDLLVFRQDLCPGEGAADAALCIFIRGKRGGASVF